MVGRQLDLVVLLQLGQHRKLIVGRVATQLKEKAVSGQQRFDQRSEDALAVRAVGDYQHATAVMCARIVMDVQLVTILAKWLRGPLARCSLQVLVDRLGHLKHVQFLAAEDWL